MRLEGTVAQRNEWKATKRHKRHKRKHRDRYHEKQKEGKVRDRSWLPCAFWAFLRPCLTRGNRGSQSENDRLAERRPVSPRLITRTTWRASRRIARPRS